jgi:isoleucyl-tRNA synthetase
LPLAGMTVVVDDPASLEPYRDIIADELNVKSVECVQRTDDTNETFGVASRVVVNARALGPRIGKDVQSVIAATKSGDYEVTPDGVVAAGHTLVDGEYELALEVADESRAVEFIGSEGFVLLHTEVSEELEREGLARDLIRVIQQERKNAGLDVSDRIVLTLDGDESVAKAFEEHRELITNETLAIEAQWGTVSGDEHTVADTTVRVGIAKA